MSKYIFKNKKGGVSIMHYTDGSKKSVEDCASHSMMEGTEIRELPDSVDLSDRSFRDAWDLDDVNHVKVDPDKARAVIRKHRDCSLLDLDKQAMSESRKPGNNMVDIDAKAQMLRDIPQDPRFTSDDVAVLKRLLAKAKLK